MAKYYKIIVYINKNVNYNNNMNSNVEYKNKY